MHLLSQDFTDQRKSGWTKWMVAFGGTHVEMSKDSLVEAVQHNWIA